MQIWKVKFGLKVKFFFRHTIHYSKLPYTLSYVVTVVDVDAEKRVDNSLVQIWKVKFGYKVKFLFRLWAQGLVKILSLSLVEILRFG